MQYLGKPTVKFTFKFRATQGRTWPSAHILVNNFQIHTQEINNVNTEMSVDVFMDRGPNNISICFFSKQERETVIEQGNIVADQSLELIAVYADDILLESWFWTDHYYLAQYFRGYKKQFPDAPEQLYSQLIWHFPGRFMITNLPSTADFWDWYQKNRTSRVLKDLVDPTGQLLENFNPLDDEDRALIKEIKEIINV
jgi:hypothetical protein